MIKPSVGRKVWYRPSKRDCVGPLPMSVVGGMPEMANTQPLDATILAVWSDRMVNVQVIDAYGKVYNLTSVALLQDDDKPDVDADGDLQRGYVEWMPYQVGQAKKDEAAPAP